MVAARTVGRYSLFGEIATGGMATVHFGWSEDERRVVAIKRLRRDIATDDEVRAMLLDEARVTGYLAHRNVVGTLEVIGEDDDLVLVMEYVAGESLAEALAVARERGERVSPDVAAAIMVDVLSGVHAAHEARDERGEPLDLVHRDLSPHNVLIAEDGAARVLDFGIAKARGRLSATATGALKGKVAYMAPEQVHGETSRRSDVFALGVVFWEMLVGARLFEGRSRAETLANVLGARVDSPRRRGVPISDAVEAIVMRALAHDPADRFTTADEMRLAIEASETLGDRAAIARWLDGLVGGRLERRRVEVRAIAAHMAAPASPSAPAPISERSPPAPARVSRGPIVAVLALGLAFGATVAIVSRRAAPPETTVASRPPASFAASPIARATPVQAVESSPPSEPAPSAAVSAGEGRPAVVRDSTPRRSRHVEAPRAATSGVRPECDPPYRREESGHLVWKRACL